MPTYCLLTNVDEIAMMMDTLMTLIFNKLSVLEVMYTQASISHNVPYIFHQTFPFILYFLCVGQFWACVFNIVIPALWQT
jgi:hypothetical protein